MFESVTLTPALLLPREQFHPFPTCAERGHWDALPADLRQALVSAGEAFLNHTWPPLPATLYMRFIRDGDRCAFEAPYFTRRHTLGTLVMAECVEDRGRFLDDIVNGIWCLCEETTWVINAHNDAVHPATGARDPLPDKARPGIDLFAAETGSLLAWVHYLLGSRLDAVSPRITARLECELRTRILDPFLTRDDFWWLGHGRTDVNNWNPWCNSNCLATLLLMESDPERRGRGVRKVLDSLDNFIRPYPADGGCDEGPAYWAQAGARLFTGLELLDWASAGRLRFCDDPLIRNMGRYILSMHIAGGKWFVNFADCHARLQPPAELIQRFGNAVGDADLTTFGAWLFAHQGGKPTPERWYNLTRFLPALFGAAQAATPPARCPLPRDNWLPGIQVMTARTATDGERGLCLAAKGGHNAESHNHNDVGSFVVYVDGCPFLIDLGVESYTRKTFSPERYDIWTMQSQYHNLPTINGVQQSPGREFQATAVTYRQDDALAEFALDLAQAYPPAAGVCSWRRTCRLVRSPAGAARIEIQDRFELAAATSDLFLSLMTPHAPATDTAGSILLRAAGSDASLTLAYDPAALSVTVEPLPVTDPQLREDWGDVVYRLRLTPRQPVQRGTWSLRMT